MTDWYPVKNSPGLLAIGLAFLVWLVALPATAATPAGESIEWWSMGMQLFGGLAIFLFGMEQMAEALKKVAGNRMKTILGTLTTNRLMGLLTGTAVTAVIQSSSVTTVMLVGFVTAGLMSLSQAIGVILGADIGTTITAQIVAFKVTKYALLLVGVGFVMIFLGKKETTRHYGTLVMGLGMIFFGMGIMSTGMKPLRSYEPFINLMQQVSNPVVGILLATAFTGLVQSSSATMGVVIAMAMQGLISLEAGIALALGANIGTCVTAGLAAIGKPREAIRVAVAHVTFKIVGVLLIVWFIPSFAELVRSISPAEAGLTGIDRLAAETPRQIANAHTIFNVGIAFLFMPLAPLFARFCEWVVPDRPMAEPVVIRPKYLDKELLSTPPLALDRARREVGRLGDRVDAMLEASLPAMVAGTEEDLQELAEMDSDIDILHGHIVGYLGQVSTGELTSEQSGEVMELLQVANHLEQIGDIIETNLVTTGRHRIEEGVVVSEATRGVIQRYFDEVSQAFKASIKAVREQDREAARTVKRMKKDMASLAEETARYELGRLVADEPNRLQTFTREMEMIESLSRIYRMCRKIARTQWLETQEPELPQAAE
ncbi:MAG: Na/Pi cotransporter family protein [Inquilinus sp.]|nr:Na/Pi cotransporter family protein [Inquilinus sp.]